MAECEVCGNDYDKAFEVHVGDSAHVFDSFECAIYALAPTCGHCGCRIVGHGVEAGGQIFCCAHCAHSEGREGIVDRSDLDATSEPEEPHPDEPRDGSPPVMPGHAVGEPQAPEESPPKVDGDADDE